MMPRRLAGLLLALALVAVATLFPGPAAPPPTAHAQSGGTELLSATMTVGSSAGVTGYRVLLFGSISTDGPFRFTSDTSDNYLNHLYIASDNTLIANFSRSDTGDFAAVLCVGERPFSFDQSDDSSLYGGYPFTNHSLSWVVDQQVELSLWEVPSKQGDWASLCASNETTLWSATLVAGQYGSGDTRAVGYFAALNAGALSPTTFSLDGANWVVKYLESDTAVLSLGVDQLNSFDDNLPSGTYRLYIGNTSYALTPGSGVGVYAHRHNLGSSVMTNGQTYTVRLVRVALSPPPETTLWTGTLTPGAGTFEGTDATGYCTGTECSPDPFGTLSPATFTHATVPYTVQRILVTATAGFLKFNPRLELNVVTPLTLYVGDIAYPLAYDRSTGNLHLTGIPTLTSGQSYTVSIRTTEPPPPPPETHEITLWTATLTAAAGTHEGSATAGYCASNLCSPNPFGSLTAATFTHADTQYGVRWILSGEDLFITGEPRLSGITLYLDSDSYPLTYNSGTQGYDVTGSIALTAGQTYAVSIRTTTTEPPPQPEGTLWTATLVSGAGPLEAVAATGYCTGARCNEGNFGSLNPATFTYKGVQYAISKLLVQTSGRSVLTLSPRLDQVTPFSLYVGDTEYPATFGSGGEEYDLTGTPTLTSGQTYTVSIRIPPPVLPPGTLWSATLTAGAGTLEGVNATGYCVLAVQCNPPFGTLSPDSFDYEGTTYSVNLIANDELYITADLHEATPFSLYVGDTEYTATFTSPDADINYALSGNISLTSGQTYTVSIRIATPETTPETTIWATTMTVRVSGGYTGYSGAGGSVADGNFTFKGSAYRVIVLAYGGSSNRLELAFLKNGSRSSLGAGMFRLTLGNRSFEFDGSAGYSGALKGYYVAGTGHGLSWSNGQTVDVSLVDFTPARPGTLWRGSLTAAAGAYSSQAGVGYCGDLPVCAPRTFGSLSQPTQFTYNAITYTVRALMSGGTGGGGGTLNLTGGNLQDQTLFVVYVGDAPYPISTRVGTRFNLGGGFPALTAGQTYDVSIVKLVDYDSDNDNLIEIANLAQLNAVRWDVDGNGSPDSGSYAAAFPIPLTNMGCATTCVGYELAADLDFDTNRNGRADAGDAYWNNGAGWGPIGTLATGPSDPYTGKFHGNGHTISNLFINRATAQVGLFGVLGGSGFVHHVGLLNVNVTTTMHDVGPLVGFMQGHLTIVAASYVGSGSVTGANQTGGLVGSNQGG